MKLETFFEKFELIADAPGAAARMRELVLELAVRGQLSERNPEDQNDPAWQAFLEEFDNRIHGTDPGPPPPFDIPSEWRWVCVDDVAGACGQKRPDEPFTYIDVASIDNERGIIKSDLEVLTPENAPSRARKLVRLGTVIYATVRPYLKNIAIIDREFSPPAIVSTAFAVLHPRPFVDSRFLFYWLRSKPFEVEVAERMKGVAYPAINDGEFRSCPVPLPPLAEQKRIVAKVNELMALCDRLEAQQQERDTRHAALVRASLARFTEAPTPANLQFLFHPSYEVSPDDLRKTILTLAVQGKLVPQDPNDEPVEVAAISRATKAKDEQEHPFNLPPSWQWVRLEQISQLINGDRSKNYPNKAEYVQEGVAWINAGHIKPDGTLSLESMQYITRKKFDSLRSGKIRPGDLVYCLRGTLGKTAIISQIEEGAVASSLVIIRLSPIITPAFAYRFLTSPLGREQIYKFDNGSAQPNLSANNVKKYWVPLPPLAEQRRIVAKVEQLMALVDELEQQLAASRATAEKLLTALVAELVNGKKNHASAEV